MADLSFIMVLGLGLGAIIVWWIVTRVKNSDNYHINHKGTDWEGYSPT